MTRLTWDNPLERNFETGIDRAVLYVATTPERMRSTYRSGVPWNGLLRVEETPIGGETVPIYVDGRKIRQDTLFEDLNITLEAYTYPDVFSLCEGYVFDNSGLGFNGQARYPFALAYRTRSGNAVENENHGYKIHLITNCLVAPSAKSYSTIGATVTPSNFTWTISTLAQPTINDSYSSHYIIDSTKTVPSVLAALEDILYGTPLTHPRFPTRDEIEMVFASGRFEVDETWDDDGITEIERGVLTDVQGDLSSGFFTIPSGSRFVALPEAGFYEMDI